MLARFYAKLAPFIRPIQRTDLRYSARLELAAAPYPPLARTQIFRGSLSLPESGKTRIVRIFDLIHPSGWAHQNLPCPCLPTPLLPPVPLPRFAPADIVK